MKLLVAAVGAIGLLVMPVAQSADASPQYFKWYPGSPMILGRGFQQTDLSMSAVEDCVTFSTTPIGGPLGDDDIGLEVSFISSYSSLLDKMGLDVEVEFHSVSGGADAKFQQQRSRVASSKNVSIVVSAHAESPQVELRDVKLKKDYSDLLDQGLVDEFIARCGTRIPYIERRGVSLSAVITILDASDDLRTKMTANASGRYGSGPVGGSARATFDSELNEAKKNHRVEVSVSARGGDAGDLLENTIRAAISESQSVDQIGEALASYAKTLKGKPARLGFQVGDMPRVDIAKRDPWSMEKQRKLGDLYERYKLLSDRWRTYEGLAKKSDPRHSAYNAAQLSTLSSTAATLASALDLLATQHSKCKASQPPRFVDCGVTSSAIIEALKVPEIRPLGPPTGSFVVAARSGPKNRNDALGPWKLLNSTESRTVLKSPSRPQFSAPDIEGSVPLRYGPQRFGQIFDAQVTSVLPNNQRHALLYLIDSERIDAISVSVELQSQPPNPKPADFSASVSLIGFGEAEIKSAALEFSKLFEEGTQFSSLSRFPLVFLFGHQGDPWRESPDPSSLAWSEFEKQLADYMSDRANLPEFGSAIAIWAKSGLVSGNARVVVKASDKFGGESALEVGNFSWNIDSELSIARVEYQFTSLPDKIVWFKTDVSNRAVVNYPSIFKPLSYKVTGLRSGRPAKATASPLKSSWPDLKILNCKIGNWKVVSTTGALDQLGLKSSLNPYDLTLEATYAGGGAVVAEFELELTGVFDYAQPNVTYTVGDPFAYCGDYRN